LALTLWIVAILSLLSVYYLDYGKKVVKKSSQLQIKLQLILESESMVELIKFYGATGVFVENRLENHILKEKIKNFPDKLFIDSHATVSGNTTILLQDTAGLIDISDISMIVDYVAEDKEKKAIIKDSMLDWYDDDDLSLLNGAEKSYYNGTIVRNENYFAAAEELFLIRGLNHLSTVRHKQLLSNLILSDGGGTYNLFTLKDDILKSRYKLTDSDMEQLLKEKKKGLKSFKVLFDFLNKRRFINFEQDGIYPSNILRGEIVSSYKNVQDKIEFLIDFNVKDEKKIFEVLYYKN